jgi:hypothetical protein
MNCLPFFHIETPLVGKSNSVEPALVSHIPATVTHMINGEAVTLGPVAVELANIVEARRIIVGGFEVLSLEHTIGVSKVELSNGLFALSPAKAQNIRGGARTVGPGKEGRRSANHGRGSSWDASRGGHGLELRDSALIHHWLPIDQKWRLLHIDRLSLWLLLNEEGLLLGGNLTNDGLL